MKAFIVALVACFLLQIVSRGKAHEIVFTLLLGVPAFVFAACAAGYVLAFFLRVVLIALFFLRYSLGQLMGVVLLWGGGMTLAVKLPGEWKALPIAALAMLLLVILAYTLAHDPQDPLFSPEFVRKTFGPKPVSADEAKHDGAPEAEATPPPQE